MLAARHRHHYFYFSWWWHCSYEPEDRQIKVAMQPAMLQDVGALKKGFLMVEPLYDETRCGMACRCPCVMGHWHRFGCEGARNENSMLF